MNIWRNTRRQIRLMIDRIPFANSMILASTGYHILTERQAKDFVSPVAWTMRRSILRQERAYRGLLIDLRRGKPRIDFRVATEVVSLTALRHPTILEVGCGNGYYSEVFRSLASDVSYLGTDYSAKMIESARSLYPSERFEVADATNLPFEDGSFEIVFNGVSLMHIVNFEKAIKEACRVAKSFIIFHSVPLIEQRATTYLTKYAYGTPVLEIIFNRSELEKTFTRNGLLVRHAIPSIPYDVSRILGEPSACTTYLCEKIGR